MSEQATLRFHLCECEQSHGQPHGHTEAGHPANFREWCAGLTPKQEQQLRDKCRWEQMSRMAVASEWGVDIG